MLAGAAVVLILQVTGYKPLGMWPGIWGSAVCLVLYIGVSLVTRAPEAKAAEFIGYLEDNLSKHRFI
jgi:SSS family solute:Na+ symporter